jgi:hypothetical protein
MATNSKPAADIAAKPLAKARQMTNLKHAERKALAKKDRVRQWPKEHQEAANERIDANLSHIREEMKKLEKS